MHHFFRSTLWLLAMLFLSQNAFGFSVSKVGGNDLKWSSNKIPYKLHSAGSDDISNGTDLSQVQAGLADWENISCSAVNFNYQGTTENRSVTAIGGGNNGINEFVWIENNNWPHGSYVLGVTGPISDWYGKILEADIAFNGLQHSWSTSGSPGWGNQQDVKNIAIHEEGHFIGAQHVLEGYNQWDPPTMAPTADPSLKTASLEDDDKLLACYLYPTTGFYSCSTNADCPDVVDNYSNGQEYYAAYGKCQNGSCNESTTQPPEQQCGPGQMGDTCFNDEACDCSFYCQDTGLGAGSICTQQCSTINDDCPVAFECAAFSGNQGNGACLPKTCGTGQLGDSCVNDDSCDCSFSCENSNGPEGFICSKGCNVFGNDCPSDYSCIANEGSNSQGMCFPTPCREAGQACDTKDNCCSSICVASALVTGFFCRDSCVIGGDACAAGTECTAISAGSNEGACMPQKNSQGEDCLTNDECKSGKCRSLTGEPDSFFCTGPCEAQEDCPCDMTCVSAGGEKLCIPGANPSCNQSNADATGSSDISGPGTGSSSSGCVSSSKSPDFLGLSLLLMMALYLSRRRSSYPL